MEIILKRNSFSIDNFDYAVKKLVEKRLIKKDSTIGNQYSSTSSFFMEKTLFIHMRKIMKEEEEIEK